MALVNDKAVFKISVKGEVTGKLYEGDFSMKLFLSLKERTKAAVLFSQVNSGNSGDQEITFLNRRVCEFLYLCEQAPEWFTVEKAFDIVDYSPLAAIYEEYDKAQKEYSDKINS